MNLKIEPSVKGNEASLDKCGEKRQEYEHVSGHGGDTAYFFILNKWMKY